MSMPRFCSTFLLLLLSTGAAPAGQLPKDITDKLDATVALAYEAAATKLPCKVSPTGKAHMLDWKDVDKCMSQAVLRVDWQELSRRLNDLRPPNVSSGDFIAAVENSLSKQALPFDKVFRVKNAQALLPLTNSILKYLPPNSLMDQPVFDRKNKKPIGTFAGVFFYEREGGAVTGNTYRLALFQYVDPQGKMQSPADKLLLDSFGIPWAKVMSQPGFRFTTEKLLDGIRR
jgi:hypothetical protein